MRTPHGTRIIAVLSGLFLSCAAGAGAQVRDEPTRLFEMLELKPGMAVAEIGAGRGEMTMAIARSIGPLGRVYATEIDPARRGEIRAAAARAQLANVTVVEAGERATNLPEACCDAIFMRDVYHHLTHPAEIGRSIVAALKPGGRMAVIDFESNPGSRLPEGVAANRGGHGITAALIAQEMAGVGLALADTVPRWLVLPSMNRPIYLVLFRRR